jgi:hypothetical protein
VQDNNLYDKGVCSFYVAKQGEGSTGAPVVLAESGSRGAGGRKKGGVCFRSLQITLSGAK